PLHVGRAVAFAALAGRSQIKRVLDLLAAPAAGDRGGAVAVGPLDQQPRPAPRPVVFFQGTRAGGTHDCPAVVGCGSPLAAPTGQRTPVADHQVGGALHEAAVLVDAFGAVEVEGDARVHATLPEVAVQARSALVAVAELVIQLVQVPQVVPEPGRRDGGVFPA